MRQSLRGLAGSLNPLALWPVMLCLYALAAFGILRLEYDDGLIRTFESKLPEYRDYQAFLEVFESDASDVLVVFEGRDMADPEILDALTEFLLDAQFVDGVTGAISPLSLRVVNENGTVEPLVPDPIPPLSEMQKRFDTAYATSQALRRLISRDRTLLVAAFPLGDAAEHIEDRETALAELTRLADATASTTGLQATLTGYPVLREQVTKALFNDLILLNAIGIGMGLAVAALALRSLTLGLLTAIAPATSLFWVLAMLGYLGITINVITVALPVLILVLATSDAIHLSIEAGRLHREKAPNPILQAVFRISPACILAALTTAVAFGALALSRSTLISELGLAGSLATLLSMAAVLITHPLVFLTASRLVGSDALFAEPRARPRKFLDLSALPKLAEHSPRLVTAAAVILLGSAVTLYLQAEPRYSLFDDLHPEEPALQALRTAESQLGPAGAMHIPVTLSKTLDIVAAHETIRTHASGAEVFSLAAFADYADAAGLTLDEMLDEMPTPLVRRLVSSDGTHAVISVLFPYQDATDTRARVRDLQASLAGDTGQPEDRFGEATGLAVMSAFVSYWVLLEFNYSFLVALVAAGGLIAIWLRRPSIALVALLPNVLPIACVGAWLTLSGAGLEFSSGLALTIAFGLAIDDTVHVLNRLRLSGSLDTPADAQAVSAAVREVAPALVITSLVLGLGMTGTLFASLASITAFGILSMAVFALALIADLLVLPSCLISYGRIRQAIAGKANR